MGQTVPGTCVSRFRSATDRLRQRRRSASREARCPAAVAETLEPRTLLSVVYGITDLGPNFVPTSINNSGMVAGSYAGAPVVYTPDDGLRHMLFTRSIGVGGPSIAYDINDAGMVVGTDTGRAAVWLPTGNNSWGESTWTDAGADGNGAYALSVDAAGNFITRNRDILSSPSAPVNGGVWSSLSDRSISSVRTFYVAPDSIASDGAVVGEDPSSSDTDLYVPIVPGNPADGYAAYSLPSSGFGGSEIIESYKAANGNQVENEYIIGGANTDVLLWSPDGEANPVSPIAPGSATAIAVVPPPTNQGTASLSAIIVGAGPSGAAWVWQGDPINPKASTYQDLTTSVHDATGWTLDAPADVNSLGQIVGTGTYQGVQHGYLLTPIDSADSKNGSADAKYRDDSLRQNGLSVGVLPSGQTTSPVRTLDTASDIDYLIFYTSSTATVSASVANVSPTDAPIDLGLFDSDHPTGVEAVAGITLRPGEHYLKVSVADSNAGPVGSYQITFALNAQASLGASVLGLSPQDSAGIAGTGTLLTTRAYMTNISKGVERGPIKETVYLSPEKALADSAIVAGSRTLRVTMRPGTTVTVNLRLRGFPPTADGNYYAVAVLNAPDGTETTAASETTIEVDPVSANLSVAPAGNLPPSAFMGARISAACYVQNLSNVTIGGNPLIADGADGLEIDVLLSPVAQNTGTGSSDSTSATAPVTAAAINVRIRLRPDAQRRFQLRFTVPQDLEEGQYMVSISIDPGNAYHESILSDNVFTWAKPLSVQ